MEKTEKESVWSGFDFVTAMSSRLYHLHTSFLVTNKNGFLNSVFNRFAFFPPPPEEMLSLLFSKSFFLI